MSTKLSAKLLALILSFSMLLTFMPSAAFAGTDESVTEDVTVMDDSAPDSNTDLQSGQEDTGSGEQPDVVNDGEEGGPEENADLQSGQEDAGGGEQPDAVNDGEEKDGSEEKAGLLAAPKSTKKGDSDTGEDEGEPLRAEGDPVAKIGDTEYTSLAEAVAAASNDDIIEMVASTEDAADIRIDKRLTIDLAGYTITVQGLITVSKDLNILDSSDSKSGKFSFPDGGSASYGFDIESNIILKLQSGTISSVSRTAVNMSGGFLNMQSDGRITCSGSGAAVSGSEGVASISGIVETKGNAIDFSGNGGAGISAGAVVTSENGAAIRVAGPEANVVVADVSEYEPEEPARITGVTGISAEDGAKATVQGGVINGTSVSIAKTGIGGSFIIAGGLFSDDEGNKDRYTRANDYTLIKGADSDYPEMYALASIDAINTTTNVFYPTLQSAVDATAAEGGDTVKLLKDVDLDTSSLDVNGRKFTLNLNGFTIESSRPSGVLYVENGAEITLDYSSAGQTGSIINDAESGYGILVVGGSKLIVNKGSIAAELCGIYLHGSDVTAVINGGTVSGKDGITNKGSTLTVNGAKVQGTRTGIVTKSDGNTTIESGVIKGDINAVFIEDTGTVYLNGGYYSDDKAGDGGDSYVLPEASILRLVGGTGEYKDYYEVVAMTARIGDEYYASLNEAIAAASADDTIVIIADRTVTTEITTNKDFTVDLAGHTVTMREDMGITRGRFTLKDSSADKTGKMKFTSSRTLSVEGRNAEIVIDSGTLEGSATWVMYIYSGGSAIINGGTLAAPSGAEAAVLVYGADSTLTVNGGAIEIPDGTGVKTHSTAHIYVNGGTITGKDAVTAAEGGLIDISGGIITGSRYGAYADNGSITVSDNEDAAKNPIISGSGDGVSVGMTGSSTFTINGGLFSDGAGNAGGFTRADGKALAKGTNSDHPDMYALADVVAVNTTTGKGYDSLQAAVDETTADGGDTIKLFKDVGLGSSLDVDGKKLTLDLNGRAITGSTTAGLVYMKNSAEITLDDSSDGASGSIINSGGSTYGFLVASGSVLTVKKGSVEGDSCGIYIDGSGVTAVINGGTVTGREGITNRDGTLTVKGGTVSGSQTGIVTKGSGTTTITGGVIEGTGDAILTADSGKVYLNGGYYSDNKANETDGHGTLPEGKKFVLAGGSGEYANYYIVVSVVARIDNIYYTSLESAIKAASAGDTVVMVADTTEDLSTVKKTITLDLAGYTVTETSKLPISNGTFTLKDSSADESGVLSCEGYYSVDVYGGSFVLESGTLRGSEVAALQVSGGASAVINGGKIVGRGSATTVSVYSGSSLMISGGSIESNSSCAVLASGSGTSLTVTGGSISGNIGNEIKGSIWLTRSAAANISGGTVSGNQYGVVADNQATAYISGGTITGTSYGVYTRNSDSDFSGGEITISGGDVSGGSFGVYAGSGTITVNNNPDITRNPVISGSGSGKSVGVSNSAAFNINGGYYSDKEGNGEGFTRPKGKMLLESSAMEGYFELTDAVAMIAETGVIYPSLNAARDAATSEHKTVKLISDIDLSDTFKTSDKTFTLDLNGHTLLGRDFGTVSVSTNSTLTIIDSSADSSGRIECKNIDAAAAVSVAGTLILESGTIEYTGNGTGDGIIFIKSESPYYSSTGITINGGTVIGKGAGIQFSYGSGQFTINDGVIKGSTSLKNNTGVKVTINGGYYSDASGNDDSRYKRPERQKLVLLGGTGELADYYVLKTMAARIGDVDYVSLADAVAAASEDDTIIMIGDNTETVSSISINKKVAIDLAGFTVTVPGTMSVSAGVTIKDTSTENTGVLQFPTETADYAIDLSSGSLTIDSGTVDTVTVMGIRQRANTTVNINADGKLMSGSEGAAIELYGLANQERRVYVYGEVEAQGDAIVSSYMIYVYAGGRVTSSNGTAITARGGDSRVIVAANEGNKKARIEGKVGIKAMGSGTSAVNGGVIVGSETSVVKEGSGSFEINGGVFSDDAGNADGFTRADDKLLIKDADPDYPGYYALTSCVAQNIDKKVNYNTIQEAIDAAEAGQTIKLLVDCEEQFAVDKSLTLDLNEKKLLYNGSIANPAHITVDGSSTALTLTGDGEITSNALCSIKVNNGASLIIDGVNLTSSFAGIVAYDTGSVALVKGEINATGNMAAAELHNQASFTMSGGSIASSYGDGIATNGSATVSITDGAIEAGKHAVNISETSTAQIDGGSFKGTTASVINKGTGTFAINGGRFSDNAGNGDAFTRLENQVLYDWDGDEWYTLGMPVAKRVAGGEDVLYTSLQDAVDAATDEDDVVYMLTDIALSQALQIRGKKVTLDIGSYTLSDSEDFDHSSGYGQLINVTCTITIQNRQDAALTLTGSEDGKVQHSGKYAVYLAGGTQQNRHYADLTMDTITVSAGSTAIRGGNYCSVIVNSGSVLSGQDAAETVKGAIAAGSGSVTVNRGTIKNENGVAVSTGISGDAYINGGTLEGATYGIYAESTGYHGVEVNDGVIIGGETSVRKSSGDFEINGGVFSDDEGNKDGYTRKDNLKLLKGADPDYPDYYALGVDKSKLRALLDVSPEPDDVAISETGTDVEEGKNWATADDWAAYKQAYEDAQAVLDDADASQGDVDAALADLGTALAKIETAGVDTTALEEALQDAVMPDKVVKSEDGKDVPDGDTWATPDDWTTYATAVNNAIDVALNGKTQDDVDGALADLIAAQELLKTANVDKEALQSAVSDAIDPETVAVSEQDGKDVPDGGKWCTSDDKAAYTEALENAEDILEKTKATQKEVDEALTALNEAAAFIKTASTDKSKLSALLAVSPEPEDVTVSETGSDVEEGKNWATAEDWAAYKQACEDAQAVIDNAAASQNDVDTALTDLGTALTMIKTAGVDKTELVKALQDAVMPYKVAKSEDGKDIPDGDPWATPDDWTTYANAVNNAIDVALNGKTQDAVDAALAALTAAEELLKTASVDKTALNNAIAAAQNAEADVVVSTNGKDVARNKKWTTSEEKQAFDDAIAAAQEVMDDPAATQNAVDDAITALQTATETYNSAKKTGLKYDPGQDPNQKGADGTPTGKGASEACADKAITSSTSEEGPKGTQFQQLRMKSTKQANASITLTWSKPSGAKKYVIYGNLCGKKLKMKKIATTTKTSYTVKKIGGKKLKKGTYYKFIVVALDKNNNVVSTSKVAHVATKGGKVTNFRSVTTKAKKNKVSIKKGKTFKLGAKAVKQSGKLTTKKHRVLKYVSTNTKVATVSSKGVIKGKKKGTCYVYVYAQNGVFKKIKVTVK